MKKKKIFIFSFIILLIGVSVYFYSINVKKLSEATHTNNESIGPLIDDMYIKK